MERADDGVIKGPDEDVECGDDPRRMTSAPSSALLVSRVVGRRRCLLSMAHAFVLITLWLTGHKGKPSAPVPKT